MAEKAHFVTEPDLKIVDGGFQLKSELIYHSAYLGMDVRVPKGFFTDLASVPRPFTAFVPTATGKNRLPAIVHDRLCDKEVQREMGIDQMKADRVFREAMTVMGVWKFRKWYMWGFVRSFQTLTGRFK